MAIDKDGLRALDARTRRVIEETIASFPGMERDDLREAVLSLLVHCHLCDRDLQDAGLPPRRGPQSGARRTIRAWLEIEQEEIEAQAADIR